MPSNLFFGGADRDDSKAVTRTDRAAKKICKDCDVKAECLTYAIDAALPYGVFGGMTVSERLSYKRRKRWAA
jgi:WhiB family redox-sensing transcriptional regulator